MKIPQKGELKKGFNFDSQFIAEVVNRAEQLIKSGESEGALSEKFGGLAVFIQKDGESNQPKSVALSFPALDEHGQKLGYEIFVGGNEVPQV